MSLKEQAGEMVKAARLAQGLTQRELAERAGINFRTISTIENGTNTTLDTLERIMAVLETPIRLEDGTPDPEQVRHDLMRAVERRLSALLPRLSQQRLEQLLADISLWEVELKQEAARQ